MKSNFSDHNSRIMLLCLLLVATLSGCGADNEKSEAKSSATKIKMTCPQNMAAGQKQKLSIVLEPPPPDLGVLSFTWKANQGNLQNPVTSANAPTNYYTAPEQTIADTITVELKRDEERLDIQSCTISVRATEASATPSQSPKQESVAQATPQGALANAVANSTSAELDALFIPSNWMGAAELGTKYVQVDRAWRENPHSAPTCDKWAVRLRNSTDWAAVGWSYPENNWGERPGRDLRGYTKLTIWLRGQNGGEKLLLKFGGHTRPGVRFPSSMPEAVESVTLARDWQKKEISLQGAGLQNIPVALVLVVEGFRNPDANQVVFFMDDPRLEK